MSDTSIVIALWAASGGYAFRAMFSALAQREMISAAFFAGWTVLCIFMVLEAA